MDDPLWETMILSEVKSANLVLIPLLVDDPLWVGLQGFQGFQGNQVLIPLLVDDPLWDMMTIARPMSVNRLNPSFSG